MSKIYLVKVKGVNDLKENLPIQLIFEPTVYILKVDSSPPTNKLFTTL